MIIEAKSAQRPTEFPVLDQTSQFIRSRFSNCGHTERLSGIILNCLNRLWFKGGGLIREQAHRCERQNRASYDRTHCNSQAT